MVHQDRGTRPFNVITRRGHFGSILLGFENTFYICYDIVICGAERRGITLWFCEILLVNVLLLYVTIYSTHY